MNFPAAMAEKSGGRSAQSCSLEIRAQPGAKRSGVALEWNGKPKVAVRAPAEDGRANTEVLEVLASALGLKPRSLELIRGARGCVKHVFVPLSLEEALRRLREHTRAN